MDLKDQPLVSIVTPVHNGEPYLEECIESVLAQTYQHWEYLIVNNCSTDRTLQIAQLYAAREARIRIHNTEQFVSRMENHNVALQRISPESKYFKVVHADDWLFPQCLMEMVTVAETHPMVGVIGAYGLNGVRVAWDGLPYPSEVMPGREICRRCLLGEFYVFGSPTSVLFRADLMRIHQDFYNAHEFHSQYSDQEACYKVLQTCDFGFVHQVLTFTRLHDGSATSAIAREGFNSDLPAQLNILTKYGPGYLSREEYEVRHKKLMRTYYRFLCQSLFHRKNKQFWDYHERALEYMGCPLSVISLLKALSLEIIDTLLSPKQLAAVMLNKVRGVAR